MSTYEQLRGARLKFLDQDPANATDGQVWYNSTTGKDRVQGIGVAAWSSASPMGTPRKESIGFGIQTAGVFCGGVTPPNSLVVEEYNGTGFSAGTNMPANRGVGVGAGTATAGLVSNGEPPPSTSTIHYDGSAWTTHGAMPAARTFIMGFGLQTAAIAAGGFNVTNSNNSYEYDGSTWTALPNINTARRNAGSTGSTTAGIIYGGYTTTFVANSEEWDGSSWSEGNDLNTARGALYSFGTQTTAVGAGGQNTPGSLTATENYDGSSWTTSPATMGTENAFGGSAAQSPNTAGISVGGNNPSINGVTQEYNFSAQVITAAAWSSGDNLSTARQRAGGFGNAQNSAVVAAGATAPPASALSATEEYDGSAWSSSGSVNTARFNMTAFGTETAGVLSGKGTPSVPYAGTTEEYNGSSWTTVSPYSSPYVNYRSSCGPETAGLLAGGVKAPGQGEFDNVVEEYDGSTWTSGTALPQYQSYNCQAGTQTAAINGGGSAGPAAPGPVTANTISLEYDGTNWTTAPNANLASPTQVRSFNGGTGTQSDAMFAGGDVNLNGIRYDGTTFRTDATYPAVRGETSAAGLASASNSILFAGAPVPSVGNTTVEYSGETTSPRPAQSLTTSS